MLRPSVVALSVILALPVLGVSQTIDSTVTDQKHVKVQLVLFADKEKYKRSDDIALSAMIVNRGMFSVFVWGNLEWGGLASFTLCVRNAEGRVVKPRALADALPYLENPSDPTQFVKLEPINFFGSTSHTSARDLNIDRPGRYSLAVEYGSLIPRAKVSVKPFFGKEDGTLQSNIVIIDIE